MSFRLTSEMSDKFREDQGKPEGEYQRAARLGEMTYAEAAAAGTPQTPNQGIKDNLGTETSAIMSMVVPEFRMAGSQAVTEHLQSTALNGINGLQAANGLNKPQSRMAQFGQHPSKDPNKQLPLGPGNAYLSHLVKFNKMNEKLEDFKKKAENKIGNIFTDQPEAAKTALSLIGVYSERNPGGLPMDFKEAKNLWFGDKEVDGTEESGFRTTVENGDPNIDPKRVRKFVNYDGSLTWEILNRDKTVQSRFTMGDYAGTKVFAQGGYKTFAELLKKFMQKKGKDVGGEFDAIRSGGM